jgi:uncharacterized alkaline shock family protein YloU
MGGVTDSGQSSGGAATSAHDLARIARSAALGCYGVKAVVGARWYQRLADRLGLGNHGVSIRTEPELAIALNVEIAQGVPRDTVLANVAEAVRYTVQRDTGRSIDQLTLTVAAT